MLPAVYYKMHPCTDTGQTIIISIMKIDIAKVAVLANLPLSSEKASILEKQLAEVLTYVERLNELDTAGVPETSQVTGLENVTRNDAAAPSLTQEEAVQNKKDTVNGLFQVKAILEDKS